MKAPAWLTVTQAREQHGIPASTVKRWAQEGRVKSRRVGARVLEINRASLLVTLANRPKPGPKRMEAR